jgi:hypothetical protein
MTLADQNTRTTVATISGGLTNKTQLQTTAATLIGVGAGYLAGKGYLGLSLTDWTTILTAAVTAGTILWPILVTRANSLKDTVGNMKNTTVVTDKASANALPDNKDVVAATPAIVDAIKKAQ